MAEIGVGWTFGRRLTTVVACGAVLRIVRFVFSKWDDPLLLNDSLYYSAQARQLAHGVWFREVFADQPGAEHGPLTSSLMALVSWGDDPFNRQRMVTVAFGIATVAIIGLLARRVAGDRVGLVAAGLAALYPNLWISDSLVMSESVSCLVISLTMWALVTWIDNPTLRAAALLGLAAGLGALARSEVVLFVPAAAMLMWLVSRQRGLPRLWTHVVVATGVAVAVMLPWLIFNLVRFDNPVLLTTNEGPALLGANCNDTYYGPAPGGWSLLCLYDPVARPDEDPSTRSARQRRQAVSYVRHHAGSVPGVVLKRVGRSLDLYALDNMVHGDEGEDRERWASWAGIASFWLLAPLAAVGAVKTRQRGRAVLLIPVLIAVTTTVLIYGGHRIRSPAEPSIVILAAIAIGHWQRQGSDSPLS